MKINRFAISIALAGLVLSSCTTSMTRTPASSDEATVVDGVLPDSSKQDLEDGFQLIMKAYWSDHYIQLKIDQLEYAYFRGLTTLEKFDALLDDATKKNMSADEFEKLKIESGVGPELAALEYFAHLAKQQLSYDFNRLIEIQNDPATPGPQRTKVVEVLEYMSTYLSEVPRSTRVALNPWAEDMSLAAPNSPNLKRAYQHLFVGNADGLVAYAKSFETLNHQKLMKQRIGALGDRRVEDLIVTFKRYQLSALGSRSPQSDSQTWSLAFAGGPHPLYSGRIMTELNLKGTPATFYVIGERANHSPIAASEISRRGFRIGTFTQTRRDLAKLFDSEIKTELKGSAQSIEGSSGQAPKLLLPPFGGVTPRVAEAVKVQGLTPVAPAVDAFDWLDHDPNHIAKRVLKQTALLHGGTILFRDDQTSTSLAVHAFLEASKNLKFAPVDPSQPSSESPTAGSAHD